MPYDRSFNNRPVQRTRNISDNSDNRSFYVCIDEVVEGKQLPKIEFGVGNVDNIEKARKEHVTSTEYEESYRPFIQIRYVDLNNPEDYYGFVRLYFSGDHRDLTKDMKDDLQRMNCDLLNFMRKQKTDADLAGLLSRYRNDDEKVLESLKKRIRAEELVDYI